VVRANSEEDAEKEALQERQCSDKWSAQAEMLVENIDVLERKAEMFDEVVAALADSLSACSQCRYQVEGLCDGEAPAMGCLQRKRLLDILARAKEVKT
jgi:hypothetical protein